MRACRSEDVGAVLQLWRQADATPGVTDNADDLRRAVAESRASVLVAEAGGQIVGSVIGTLDGWRGVLPQRLPVSPWGLLRVVFRLVDQLLQGPVDRFLPGAADPLVTDDPLDIDDIVRRRTGVPPGRDRLARDGSPGHLLLSHYLFELFRLMADDVDADQGKRLLFQVLDERPLVGPTGASSQSAFRPEVEQHHLPTVVAQFELLAVLIFTIDVLGFLADGEVAHLE